jgi:SH3 domain protein
MGVKIRMKIKSIKNIFDHGAWLFIFLLFQSILLFSQITHAEVNDSTASGQMQQNVLEETPADRLNPATQKPQQAPEFKQDPGKTAKELQRLRQNLADMEQENQRLRKDAEKRAQADATQAAALDDSAAAKKELEDMKAQLTSIKDENRALRNNNHIKWFIAGGGVFLLGWLIGFAVGRMKKKRPSLL